MADGTFENLVVNNNLAIGTTEPAAQLHVVSSEGISSKVFVASINGSLLQVTAEPTSASIGTATSHALNINTNGLPRIQISSEGNVGIGTDTTPANLQVKGNVTANAFSGNGTSLSGLVKQAGDTMTGPLTIQSNLSVSGNVGVGTPSATDAKLTVNGTVKATAFQGDGSRLSGKVSTAGDTMTGPLTIQSNLSVNGNVGIGTDKPTVKLEVNGNIKAAYITISRQSGGQFSDMATFESRNPEPPYINWFHNRLGDNPVRYGYIQAGDFGNSKELRFVTENGANFSFTNGNVGIGTANPNYKLEVAGDIKASSIHSKPKVFSFKVEGDFDKFYPVVFYDDNWGDGPTELEINRPGTHTDSTWRGALNSRFTFHSSAWGNGASFCRAEIYSSGNQFIAGYGNNHFNNFFVIWLRGGGTTYFWRANHFVSLGDYSAKEKITKVNNDDSTAVTYPIKTNIDPYVLNYGISFDQNFVVQGNVGIGTANPAYKLDVAGAAHASSFPTSSDVRLKKDVTQLTNVLEKLEKIRGVAFEWNELYESLGRSTGHKEIGVTAQEVEAVFPELVTTWGDEGYKAVDYGRLTGVLIEAAKELKAENLALKQRIEVLEKAMAGSQAKT
jgi:hypothetical protein